MTALTEKTDDRDSGSSRPNINALRGLFQRYREVFCCVSILAYLIGISLVARGLKSVEAVQ